MGIARTIKRTVKGALRSYAKPRASGSPRKYSMTWGELPSYRQFLKDIRRINPDEGKPYLALGQRYSIEAHPNTDDARAMGMAGVKPYELGGYGIRRKWKLTARELYALLKKASRSDPGGSLGDLGSSIMTTLGYEWI